MNHINALDEKAIAKARAEVVRVAKALVARTVPFVDGVRGLRSLLTAVSKLDHDPDFMLFVAIDSESDHIPVREVRAMSTEEWLAKCDREAQQLEEQYEAEVKIACERLVERFSSEA